MPVYEYECSGCQKIFEIQQRIADTPISVCPSCGENVKKLISMSSFRLKGGGWYTDGYSGTACGKNAQGDSAPCSDSSAPPSCPVAAGSCCNCPAATP
ncbi:zinc ribbon domain-containing protein [uncultured Desulfobulbus sp.]|uniref:FmdB family zinc ribbon protein n=1 Tax=uncultured Desulfobulbus sp. TaxID=239745 RepID=UPI0029C7AA51|nr:zinc ribbon domain-containing protein [uncultured Desulfobulbus sp.]